MQSNHLVKPVSYWKLMRECKLQGWDYVMSLTENVLMLGLGIVAGIMIGHLWQ